MTSLIEYDLRHADDVLKHAWIQVHGALGGRFDHELVNVLEFAASLTRMERTAAFQLGPDVALSTMPIRGSMNIGDCFSIAPLQITGPRMLKFLALVIAVKFSYVSPPTDSAIVRLRRMWTMFLSLAHRRLL